MLRGIDVSQHRSDLRLSNVPADFVIAKATGGTEFVDSACDMFVQAAIALNRLWGVYHYYSDGYGGDDPVAEADFFIRNIQGYLGKGILVLDWEKGGNPHWSDVGRAKAWLDRVYEVTGIKPLIYMSLNLVQTLDWSEVIAAGYGLWMAAYVEDNDAIVSYAMDPGRDPSPAWDGTVGNVLWQFTSNGKFDGYSGPLDCNFFYGDRNTWAAYARSNRVTAPLPPVPEVKPTTTTTTTELPPAVVETTTWAVLDLPAVTTTTTHRRGGTAIPRPIQEFAADNGWTLAKINKAIGGFVAGVIVTWATKHGITITGDLPGLIGSLFGGLIVALGVYFAPRNAD